MRQLHHRACHLCEAICGLIIETEGERVLSIRGDDDDPLSRGHLCPKATALQDIHEDKDRLQRPLRRRGRDFEEVEWDVALDEAADRIRWLQQTHGDNSLAVYLGNPTVHSLGAMTFGQWFVRALKTRSHASATSLDQLPHMLSSLLLFGNQLLLPVPDIDRTKTLLMFGANPVASNGSIMTAPGMKRRLRALKERGGRFIVVDPRRTETARLADQHIPIYPGTDAALLLGLVHLAFRRGPRLSHLAPLVDRLEDLDAATRHVDLDEVARFTGVEVNVMHDLVERLFEASPAAVYGRVGLCTQEFGGLAAFLVTVLNLLTGNLDREGGVMFPQPAIDLPVLTGRTGSRGSFGRRRTRVRGLPYFGGEMPAACLAEEMEVPGEGQLRGLITHAGNPVLSTPNGPRLDAALAKLEVMVSIDFYVNETTRHAHLLFPPSSPLERDHYDLIFHGLAVRNTARFNKALFARPAHGRHDWEIFLELTARLARSPVERGIATLTRALLREAGPRPLIDVALRTGPHRLSVSQLLRTPSGRDLGPLRPNLVERLQTSNGRIDVLPAPYLEDLPRLLAALGRERVPLVLIGRRDLRSNNSWMHNSRRLMKGDDRCTLLMHPDDASTRGIADGDLVRIESESGSALTRATHSDELLRGVVSLPHGFGHDRPGTRLSVAAQRPGVSLNDLTSDGRIDRLSGNAVLNGVPVSVARAEEAISPLAAKVNPSPVQRNEK